MIQVAAGFTILAISIAGVAILIASAVLAFFEHARPAWRYRTATKIAASLSICYGSNLFSYCCEAAPSLLFGAPVYGQKIHTAAGWVAIATNYSSVLHIFLLSLIRIDFIYDSDARKDRASWVTNLALIFVWLISGGLAALVLDRTCSYTFSIEDLVYRCDKTQDSTRLLIVYVTLSGAFLLVSLILAVYRFLAKIDQSKKGDRVGDDDLLQVRKQWTILLGNELLLSGAKLAAVAITTAMSSEILDWHGLLATIFVILCDILALWLYFRAMVKSLQIYARFDESRRRQARSVSFARGRRCRSRASVGSRHSCRGSLHRSRSDMVAKSGKTRVTPLDVVTLERRADAAMSEAEQSGKRQAWRTQMETSLEHDGSLSARRRSVPVVQVQVYRGGYDDDVDSLCNFCSDSEGSDSLKERSLSVAVEPDSSGSACPIAFCNCRPSTSFTLTRDSSAANSSRSVFANKNLSVDC